MGVFVKYTLHTCFYGIRAMEMCLPSPIDGFSFRQHFCNIQSSLLHYQADPSDHMRALLWQFVCKLSYMTLCALAYPKQTHLFVQCVGTFLWFLRLSLLGTAHCICPRKVNDTSQIIILQHSVGVIRSSCCHSVTAITAVTAIITTAITAAITANCYHYCCYYCC